MNANLVEPTARAQMGGTKRFWNRVNAVYPSTQSTADSYVITPSVPVTGYGLYERWATRFNIANASTSPTMLVSSLPALNIKKYVAGVLTAPASGDIQGGVAQTWYYDGLGNAILENPVPVVVQNFTSIASTSNGGINYSAATGAIVTRVDPSLLTTFATPTSSDSILGQRAGAIFASAFPLPSLITNYPTKAAPNSSDSILIYDTAASGAPAKTPIGAAVAAGNTSPFTVKSTSADQVIPSAGTVLTVAHNLGVAPFGINLILKNVTGEGNYSTGDLVYLGNVEVTGNIGWGVYADATNVAFINGSAGNIAIKNKTTGADFSITIGNWKLVVKAWA